MNRRSFYVGVLVQALLLSVVHGQKYLPAFDLEAVGQVNGIATAFDATPGSDETVIGTREGRFYILKGGVILESPILDINSKLLPPSPRSGPYLSGVDDFVLSPDFSEDRSLFVTYYSADAVALRLSRFMLPPTGEPGDPVELVLLEVPIVTIDEFVLIPGSDLGFGPDGFLYLGVGDGTIWLRGFSVQRVVSQDLSTLEGKILRLDVGRSEVDRNYSIPVDNPFVDDPGARPEIWALGFRYPRVNFVSDTNELFILDDVAQDGRGSEEINVGTTVEFAGRNFGWPYFSSREESYLIPPPDELPEGLTWPVFEPFDSHSRTVSGTKAFVSGEDLVFASSSDLANGGGATYAFSMDPTMNEGFQIGENLHACCRDGFTAAGQGAAGQAYFGDETGAIYQSVSLTEISPPAIFSTGRVLAEGAVVLFYPELFMPAVFYTLDGSEPTLESPRYDVSNRPKIFEDVIVKAKAYHPDIGFSAIAEREVTVRPATVSIREVVINPYIEIEYKLATLTPGAVIRYTLDGSTPDENSPVYDANVPLILSGPERRQITARAFHPVFGVSEEIDTYYSPGIMRPSIVGDPEFIRPGQEVALTGTMGTTIHYTLDGSRPDENSPIYTGPFNSKGARWIETFTTMDGFDPNWEVLPLTVRTPESAAHELIAGGGSLKDDGAGIPALDAMLELPPASMAMAADGTLYSISKFQGRSSVQYLYALDQNGMLKERQFTDWSQQISDIAFLPNGDLVMARPGYPGVAVMSPGKDTEMVTYGSFGVSEFRDGPLEQAYFRNPSHVAVDSDGSILVSDSGRLRRITPDGKVETIGGYGWRKVVDQEVPMDEVKFDELRDIALGPDGTLFIGDGGRLLRSDRFGMISFVAGSDSPGHRDGTGDEAVLWGIDEISVDLAGNAYLRTSDSVIRRVSPEGEVSTITASVESSGRRSFPDVITGLSVQSDGTLVVGSDDDVMYRLILDDADGDGIADSAENGALRAGVDDNRVDSDGDGISNVIEHVVGLTSDGTLSDFTSPKVITLSPEELALILPTQAGKTYRLEGSEDLKDWRLIRSFDAGPFSATLQFIYPESWRESRYFRITE